jgi:membrane-associated phospholipid phosphatase
MSVVEQLAPPLLSAGDAARLRIAPHAAAALLLGLLAWGAVAIDAALARHVREEVLPGDAVRVLHWSEIFAHGGGVALVLLGAWLLDPSRRRRRRLLRVAAAAYGAGLLANGVKLLIARSRPDELAEGPGALDTFGPWLPFLPGRLEESWGHAVQSFPSGHAATAVAFALTLGTVYPRGRWLFLFFAGMASFQRMAAGAHFLSDVLAGAALGCLVVALWGDGTPGGNWLARFERLMRARHGQALRLAREERKSGVAVSQFAQGKPYRSYLGRPFRISARRALHFLCEILAFLTAGCYIDVRSRRLFGCGIYSLRRRRAEFSHGGTWRRPTC